MNNLKTELIYSAASVNRHPNCLDYEDNRLIFATSKSIAIFDKRLGRIIKFLHYHSDQVSGAQFIKSVDENQNLFSNEVPPKCNHCIMSTSYDKSAIIWKPVDNDDLYTPLYHLEGHAKAVIFGHSAWISRPNGVSILFTSTSDMENVTKLWADGKLVYTLKTNYIVLTSRVATITIGSSNLDILCLGGSDDNIHLFNISNDFEPVHLIDILGHSDWVRSIDIIRPLSKPYIMLASASQDRFVRVWRIQLTNTNQNTIRKKTTPVILSTGNSDPHYISVVLETVLAGHEGRVHDIKWSRLIYCDEAVDVSSERLRLLSCSGDKSIIIWESTLNKIPTESNLDDLALSETTITDDIWQEVHRVGEAGECNLGFLGACLSRNSLDIFAYSLNGAIHSWSLSEPRGKSAHSEIGWIPEKTIGGHFGPVTDLDWQRDGNYLLSSSLDKTCRVHGYINKLNAWNEISRPQVHGYEINCLAAIDNLKLASGSDEKTIRLFEATTFYVKTFENLTSVNLFEKKTNSVELAAHAQVPALGLSNRAISSYETYPDPNEQNHEKDDNLICSDELNSAPVEEILLQNTLWPEIQKLYGHSYEIYSLDSDREGRYMASACKANKSEFAKIIIWDLVNFNKISTLDHHTLTVTRLKYSPNNKYLLSVSRDRTWCLWENDADNDFAKLAFTTNQTTKHSRIIWDCCWTPDSSCFITVSRDKQAIAWDTSTALDKQSETTISDNQYLTLDDPIQAVDTCEIPREDQLGLEQTTKIFLVAFGLEGGHVILSKLSTITDKDCETSLFKWTICCTIDSHRMPIRRLAFRPTRLGHEKEDGIVLASAAEDCILSLHSIKFCTS